MDGVGSRFGSAGTIADNPACDHGRQRLPSVFGKGDKRPHEARNLFLIDSGEKIRGHRSLMTVKEEHARQGAIFGGWSPDDTQHRGLPRFNVQPND